MNFKRVLVLVMTLVMVITTCVTPVLAAHRPETKHEHLEDVLNNPEYVEKYEEIKAIVESIAKDIEENHEEYYAEGYAYALENGYIGTAIEVIELALSVLPEINFDEVGMTDELRADLEAELDALEPTLEKLLAVLESGEASEFDGFVKAALTFESDLYIHMNNIYAILEQAAIDANQLVLVPAFNEVVRLLNEEVIPAIEETVDAFVDAVVDHVTDVLAPYYDAVVGAMGVAYDTYELLVETIVKINLYVEDKIDAVVDAYTSLVWTLTNIYGTVENAINTACDFYNGIINAVIELNTKVENEIARVENFIIEVTNAYKYTVNLLVEVYGHVTNAVIVAGQICNSVVDFWVENKPLIEDELTSAAEIAAIVYAEVVEIIETAYAEKDDVYYVATKICEYVIDSLYALNDAIQGELNGAYVGDYELTDDSAYISFGNASYADNFAKKLNLSDKHTVATFGSDYIDSLVNADLVTVKLDNGSFVSLMEHQVEAKIAEVIRSNSDLMAWYEGIPAIVGQVDNWFWLPQEHRDNVKNGLTEIKGDIDSIIDLEKEVIELDWDKYLDEEGKAALVELLAHVKAEVIEQGIPEYYYIEINPIIEEMLVENGLGGIFTLFFEPIVVPAADIVVFAVENMIYGYAEFVGNLTYVFENASDDATIVLTPVSNPLYGYSFKGIDFSAYAESADTVVDLLNMHLFGIAVANENVVFVDSENADDIYNALNVYCDHIVSSCTDTTCDRCLARVTALGHNYTNYVFTPSESCKYNGKEMGTCERCGAVDVREVPNTKGEHDFAEATCTKEARCKVCSYKLPGSMTDHVLEDWRITKDPTAKSEGTRERKCKYCEYKIVEAIPYKTLSTIATIGIIFCCVVVLGGVSAFVVGIFKRRKKI